MKRSGRHAALVAAVVFVWGALFGLGCPPPVTPVQPRPAACETGKLGPNLVGRASAQAVVNGHEFTLEMATELNAVKRGASGGSLSHVVIRRAGAIALEVDTHLSPKGELEVRVHSADGFDGPKEVVLTSADRQTFQGTVDGKAIAPFSAKDKPEAMKFADGSPMPAGRVDDDIKQAVPLLANAVRDRCPAAKQPATPAARPSGPSADPPGHYSDPLLSSGCIACQAGAGAGEIACVAGAAIAAASCTIAYGICLAVGIAICETAYFVTLCTGCHIAEFPDCGGGGPCCPTDCKGDFCCDVGETCVGSDGLCCSPGFKGCGSGNCCAPTDTCMGDGTCCPSAAACGGKCCPGDQPLCLNTGTSACCTRAHACDGTCCNLNESCVNHACSACANCNGPNQECCFGQCCSGPQIFCDADSKSCKCKPSCSGKCGGAPDGCGGTCTAPCDASQKCFDQSCCTPSCDGKSCGAPDGCGGKCDGTCPHGKLCNDSFKCVPGGGCGAGRVDCCGDGSCCMTATSNQCYKCVCGDGATRP